MGIAIAKVIVEKGGLKALVQPQATSPFLAVDNGTVEFGMSPSFRFYKKIDLWLNDKEV